MTTLNCYATLAEFKANSKDRGGSDVAFDAYDDIVIERLLKSASRYLDGKTGRHYYPVIQTRYFDVPADGSRFLEVDDDLLEIISVTNGDGNVIPSTEYLLYPRSSSPALGIRLLGSSTYYWSMDSSGDTLDVIAVNGIWGFHNRYSLMAWNLATTAAEAMDTGETGYDVTSVTNFAVGDLLRFDNELGYISAVAASPSASLTIARGANGSTAATHLTSISLYTWQVMDEAKTAVIEWCEAAYKRRYGQSMSATETITAAGIVLAPKEIPASVTEFITNYRKHT